MHATSFCRTSFREEKKKETIFLDFHVTEKFGNKKTLLVYFAILS